jgi:Uma2 family endonuclease
MPISEETYKRVALEDPEGRWELECGRLRRRPEMTTEHGQIDRNLIRQFVIQLDPYAYTVGDNVRLRISPDLSPRLYVVPDLCVVPMAMVRRLLERPGTFEVYDDPVPFVAEVWSPSTGGYDVDSKLPEYRRRRDREIWRIHPYERTVTVWRLQPDGSYTEAVYRDGSIAIASLPGVTIKLDEVLD